MRLAESVPQTLLQILEARQGLPALLSAKAASLPCADTDRIAAFCDSRWRDWDAGAVARREMAAATLLQAVWRGRSARHRMAAMVRGAVIMFDCPFKRSFHNFYCSCKLLLFMKLILTVNQ